MPSGQEAQRMKTRAPEDELDVKGQQRWRCCSSTEWFVGYTEMQAMLCCRSNAWTRVSPVEADPFPRLLSESASECCHTQTQEVVWIHPSRPLVALL